MSNAVRNFEEMVAADYMKSVYEYLMQDGVSHENPRHISAAMAHASKAVRDGVESLAEKARKAGVSSDSFFGFDQPHATATAVYVASDLAGMGIDEIHPYCEATSFVPALSTALAFNLKIKQAYDIFDMYSDDGANSLFGQDYLTESQILKS